MERYHTQEAEAWRNNTRLLLIMMMIAPSLASSGETCLSSSSSAASSPVDERVLLQRGVLAALPINTAWSIVPEEAVAALAAWDTTSNVSSHLEAGIQTASNSPLYAFLADLPEGELSKAKKAVFLVVSLVFMICIGLSVQKLISDYEASASAATPPWYVDTNMLLKISCITLLSWLSVGLVAFTQVVLFNDPPRHLNFVESFYLSAQIVTTVGYGDLTPTRPEGQFFLACYILSGVTLVAIVIAQLLDRAMNSSSTGLSVESLVLALGKVAGYDYDAISSDEDVPQGSCASGSKGLNLSAHMKFRKPRSSMYHHFRVARSIAGFILAVAVGTVFFRLYPGEGKSIWQAFYMSCVTLTTVGFGSIHPTTQGGYLFSTFWMLVGVGCTANMIGTLSDALMKHRKELTGSLMKEELLKEMDADGSGTVDKLEFLRYELVRKGVCQKHDIDSAIALFDELDSNGNGELDVDDLKRIAAVS